MTINFKTVLVNRNLAKVVYRAVAKRRLPYNYCVACLDISGKIYIQLSNADWLRKDQTYINPHTRR